MRRRRRLARFPQSWELWGFLQRVCEIHPETAARAFAAGSRDVRRALAVFVAEAQPPSPGLQDVLVELVRDGGPRAADAERALALVGVPEELVIEYMGAVRREWREKPFWAPAASRLKQAYRDAQPRLGEVLSDPADRDRARFRDLVLEASFDYRGGHKFDEQDYRDPLPDIVLERTRAWLESPIPYLSDTAAIALTGFGVPGYEDRAVQALARDPALLRWVLEALAAVAVAYPQNVDRHAEALARAVGEAAEPTVLPNPLGEYLEVGTPEFVVRGVRLLRDPELSPEFRGEALLKLEPEMLPRPLLIELLDDELWHRSMANQYFFYSFLEDVGDLFRDDEKVAGRTRAVLLRFLTEPEWLRLITPEGELDAMEDIDFRELAVQALGGLLQDGDAERVVPIAANPALPISLRHGALQLLSQGDVPAGVASALVGLLEDESLRFLAAKFLSRSGEPRALGILVEDGLKRMGPYSWVELDASSFAAYGDEGESALLSLMSYENRATQQAVRTLLGELGSARGAAAMRAELAERLEAGEAPPPGAIEGLIAFGDNPFPMVVDSLVRHPENEDAIWLSLDCAEGARVLRPELESEVEPERARVLRRLLENACNEEAASILREIAANHTVDAVRSVLSPRNTR